MIFNGGSGRGCRSGANRAYIADDVDDGDDENGQEKGGQSNVSLSVFFCLVYFFKDSLVRCRRQDLMWLEASGDGNLAGFR